MSQNELTLAQLQLSEVGGMSYVIRQRDGSFIIIDGGVAEETYEYNKNALIAHLKRSSHEAKPVIAAWFITHFHLNHVDLAARFLVEYKDEIEVKLFAYNHPGHREILRDIPREEAWEAAMNAHPDAERRILKTGEIYDFSSCKVRVLLYEETGRLRAATVGQNSISAALAFDFDNGRRFMSLGDCDTARLTAIYDEESKLYRTKEELKSDILNVPHHGLPMGSLEFVNKNVELYKIIDAGICLFSIDGKSFLSHDRFTNDKWADNQYLLHSGAKCFHQDHTTLIDLDTMEIQTFNY
jgi:beta-lactamase superfamily II metal-dependent hydrolase